MIRSSAVNGDATDRDFIESVSRTTAETVLAEKAVNIYDALSYLNNTDAWQNATLANLQFSDAW